MILCCGEALIDMVRTGSQGFLPLPGGSPYNTAIAIGRIGVPVAFLGKYSRDFFGEMLLGRLRENNVRDDFIIRSSQNTTLAFVKLEEGKEPEYVFYTEGTADRGLRVEELPEKLPDHIRCLSFGSISMTMEPVASAIESLVLREKARQDGPVISFDPNIRPFMIREKEGYIRRMERWIAASTMVKISAADFDYIYPGLETEKALGKILSLGPCLGISTLGSQGAVALLRREDGGLIRAEAPVVEVPVQDTIGAGDTFHGSFLAWLELNGKMSPLGLTSLTEKQLYDALFFANTAASLVCSRRGAEPPSFGEIQALQAQASRETGL